MELIPADPEFSLPTKLDFSACTQHNIERIAQGIINSVEEGYADPVEEMIKAKTLEKLSDMVVEGLKEKAKKAMGGEKRIEHKGVQLQVKSGAKVYDFSDSAKWCSLNQQLEEIKEKIKQEEELMKKAMDFENVTDGDGVVIPPARITGGKADSLSITIPKK